MLLPKARCILALVGVAIWDIAARRSKSVAPLIATLVVTGISLATDLVSIVDSPEVTGRIPYLGLLLQFGLIVQTIRLLRLKPSLPQTVVA